MLNATKPFTIVNLWSCDAIEKAVFSCNSWFMILLCSTYSLFPPHSFTSLFLSMKTNIMWPIFEGKQNAYILSKALLLTICVCILMCFL